MPVKFFRCEQCGNIITFLTKSGAPESYCTETMKELVPGTSDGAAEKHVPVVKVDSSHVTVSVGSVEHPALSEHHIEWIVLETEEGTQTKYLEPGKKPEAEFALTKGDKAVAVYEYCNLHGLWKTSL
ncbi:desulfoferrodoxin family protein [Clostridium sp. AM58-1XD]|uniref:desulfoferrodoxin family protein n=1 Tax=Clostridium sp. AM58-1XD TaxID=2292307 RepID=UPI000E501973|nr:desulfoferrodoxin family protein [Clostridium sp. AM58-1XD]RGY98922.1 desulfoferrodoxin [Clostridium sp. AM58-1XD]